MCLRQMDVRWTWNFWEWAPNTPAKLADVNELVGLVRGEGAPVVSAQEDCGEVLAALHESRHEVRKAAQIAFEAACFEGKTGVARLCLACLDVDTHVHVQPGHGRVGDTVLIAAVRRGDVPMALLLVSCAHLYAHQLDETGAGESALHVAAARGSDAIVRAILRVSHNLVNRPDVGDSAPLHLAAYNGHLAVVSSLLLVETIEANIADGRGQTPLLVACGRAKGGVVRALLAARGIDVNKACHAGKSPLFVAAGHGNLDVVLDLLRVDGIDANHADRQGTTPLMAASAAGKVGAVRALLAAPGVAVNQVRPTDPGTPPAGSALACAVHAGHIECVRVLVACKDVDINQLHDGRGSVLHDACLRAEQLPRGMAMVEALLMAGGCRFKEPKVFEFALGVDYWVRRHHRCHGWRMKEAVVALLLVRARLSLPAGRLPHMPEELWLLTLTFLRSADFAPQ